MKFSVVIPLKGRKYLRENLPSWCRLNPDEIILCVDNPVSEKVREIAETIGATEKTEIEILEIARNPDYRFHQAWARRKGFLAAKNDVILTGDIDLTVFNSCLKAVELAGKNSVGLVSLMKIRKPKGIFGLLRSFMDRYVRKLIHHTPSFSSQEKGGYFTGLYVLFRPFWIDSEDEGIKALEDPKTAPIIVDVQYGGYIGEDTYLKNCMEQKYRCLFLSIKGAIDHGVGLEETVSIQRKIGQWHFLKEKRISEVLVSSIINMRSSELGMYLYHVISYVGVLQTLIFALIDVFFQFIFEVTACAYNLYKGFLPKEALELGILNTFEALEKYEEFIWITQGIVSHVRNKEQKTWTSIK